MKKILIFLILFFPSYTDLLSQKSIIYDNAESYYYKYFFLLKTVEQVFTNDYIRDHNIKNILVHVGLEEKYTSSFLNFYDKSGALVKRKILSPSNIVYKYSSNRKSIHLSPNIKSEGKLYAQNTTEEFSLFTLSQMIKYDSGTYIIEKKYKYKQEMYGNLPMERITYLDIKGNILKEIIINKADVVNLENTYKNGVLSESNVLRVSKITDNLYNTKKYAEEIFYYNYNQDKLLSEVIKQNINNRTGYIKFTYIFKD